MKDEKRKKLFEMISRVAHPVKAFKYKRNLKKYKNAMEKKTKKSIKKHTEVVRADALKKRFALRPRKGLRMDYAFADGEAKKYKKDMKRQIPSKYR